MNIVWLAPPNLPSGFRKVIQRTLHAGNINLAHYNLTCLTEGCLYKRTKTIWDAVPEKKPNFLRKLEETNADMIVINDKAALHYITGKYTSLALCRGSIYPHTYANGRTVPCLVIDEVKKTKYTKDASFLLLHDIRKLNRWTTGKLKPEVKFAYTVCSSEQDLLKLADWAAESVFISVDIETAIGQISCSGYTCVTAEGKIHTFVIPFIDTTQPDGCYWRSHEEEVFAWQILKQVHQTKAFKVLQNGSYDSVYFIIRRFPLRNYVCDTLHAWHSIHVELSKRIDYIASIVLDGYQYWKDAGKEDAKEDDNEIRMPKTKEGLANYWLYNALDCHNTLLIWLELLKLLTHRSLAWTLRNYIEEFMQQFGPAFNMTMRGVNYNKQIHFNACIGLQEEADAALETLLVAVGDTEFNPKSSQQVASILYDVFRLKPWKKKGKTTDEKILKMIKNQNPMASWFMNVLWKHKKAANNISKYGSNLGKNNRILYKMAAGVTDTSRYASRKHDLWCGVNIQNVPYLMRQMIEPDPDWVLVDVDYAQADAYFTAHELDDEKFIFNMLSDKDTHCLHCEHFFKIPYEKLYDAHKQKEDWVSHNVTGVRSITKRVVYGANYLMSAGTLFITMEREPVRAAAKALGYTDADAWTDAKLTKLCDWMLKSYFHLYPNLLDALHARIDAAVKRGGLETTAWGFTRVFMGDLSNDANIQRQFAAFLGQGGTAGNINKALKNIFYKPAEMFIEASDPYTVCLSNKETLEDLGVMLLFQVHDSVVFQVPKDKLYLIDYVLKAMANECTLHGRTFTVPVEADVGLGWGKRLMSYKPGITYEDIQQHDNKWWEKYNETA